MNLCNLQCIYPPLDSPIFSTFKDFPKKIGKNSMKF